MQSILFCFWKIRSNIHELDTALDFVEKVGKQRNINGKSRQIKLGRTIPLFKKIKIVFVVVTNVDAHRCIIVILCIEL